MDVVTKELPSCKITAFLLSHGFPSFKMGSGSERSKAWGRESVKGTELQQV